MKCPSCGWHVAAPYAKDERLLHFRCPKCEHTWASLAPAAQQTPEPPK